MKVRGRVHAPNVLTTGNPTGTQRTRGWKGPQSRSGQFGQEKDIASSGARTNDRSPATTLPTLTPNGLESVRNSTIKQTGLYTV